MRTGHRGSEEREWHPRCRGHCISSSHLCDPMWASEVHVLLSILAHWLTIIKISVSALNCVFFDPAGNKCVQMEGDYVRAGGECNVP